MEMNSCKGRQKYIKKNTLYFNAINRDASLENHKFIYEMQ